MSPVYIWEIWPSYSTPTADLRRDTLWEAEKESENCEALLVRGSSLAFFSELEMRLDFPVPVQTEGLDGENMK